MSLHPRITLPHSNLVQNHPNRRSLNPHLLIPTHISQHPLRLLRPKLHTSPLDKHSIPFFLNFCKCPTLTLLSFNSHQLLNQFCDAHHTRDVESLGYQVGRHRGGFPDFGAQDDVKTGMMFGVYVFHAWQRKGWCSYRFQFCCFLTWCRFGRGCGCFCCTGARLLAARGRGRDYSLGCNHSGRSLFCSCSSLRRRFLGCFGGGGFCWC